MPGCMKEHLSRVAEQYELARYAMVFSGRNGADPAKAGRSRRVASLQGRALIEFPVRIK